MQYPRVHQHGQDAVQVILHQLVFLGYLLTDIVKSQLIVYLLQEKVSAVVAAPLVAFDENRRLELDDDLFTGLLFCSRQLFHICTSGTNWIFVTKPGLELVN